MPNRDIIVIGGSLPCALSMSVPNSCNPIRRVMLESLDPRPSKDAERARIMPEHTAADTAPELENERRLLVKAEADIESGWRRLRNQQDLLNSLQASGQNTVQAERLIELLKGTLVEWERHRAPIEQRIAYLEAGGAGLS